MYRRFAARSPLTRIRLLFEPVGDLSIPENRARDRQRRAALSAAMSMIAKLTSVATQLITVPITLHYLGPERYGMWLIMSSLVTMLSFADFGIGNGILNTVAAAYGRDDKAAMRVAISSGFVALGTVTVAILLALALSYRHVGWYGFFNVRSPLARAEAGPAIAAFVLCFAFSVPATIVQRVQLGMQRGFMTSVWLCIGSVLTLPTILVATWFHAGLPMLVAVFVGAPLIANLTNSFLFFGWLEPQLRPSFGLATRGQIGEAVRYGSYFVLIQLGNSVTAGCVPIIVAHVVGPQFVAQYTVPERLLALVVMLASMYVQPLWPAYREALVRGDGAWVIRTYRRTLVTVLCAAAFALAAIGLAMPMLLHLWVGSAVRPSTLLIAGLCLYKTIESTMWVNAILLNGLNVLVLQAVMALLTAGGFILFGVLVCKLWGVATVPWSGAIVLGLVTLLPGMVVIQRRLARLAPGVA